MASSLILHKRITTTVAKAKALRKYVEPLITKSKTDTTHSRRVVFSYLQDKETVRELFDEVSEKITQRPGGYTRIIKTGSRLGDNADMCIMELVDYNELLLGDTKVQKSKTRRGARRGKKDGDDAPVAAVADQKQKKQAEKAVEEADEKSDIKAQAQESDATEVEEKEIVAESATEEKMEAEAPMTEAEAPAEESGSDEAKPENEANSDKEEKAG